jgi:hypothetical protein
LVVEIRGNKVRLLFSGDRSIPMHQHPHAPQGSV